MRYLLERYPNPPFSTFRKGGAKTNPYLGDIL